MASELDGIEGIMFEDEAAVRREVAAQIAATSSAEAFADKAKIEKVIADLSNEEIRLYSLQQIEPLTAAIRIQISEASANAKRLSKALVALQKEADAKAAERKRVAMVKLEVEAAREAKSQAALQERFRQENAAAAVAGRANNNTYQRGDADNLKRESSAAAPSGSQTATALRTFIRPIPSSQALNRAAALGTASKRRSGTGSTMAIEQYTGGDLLPSVNQVTVSRKELNHYKKHGSRAGMAQDDDSDSDVEVVSGPARAASSATVAGADIPAGPWTPMSAVTEHQDDGSEMLFKQRLERLGRRKEAAKRSRERFRVKAEQGTQEAADEARLNNEDEDEDDVFVELFHGQQLYLQQHVFDSLLDYQQKGVQWLLQHHLRGEGAILGDEMGLGKTVQIASMLNALHTSQRLLGPVLIAAPLTVMNQWISELHRWAPDIRAVKYHSSSSNDQPKNSILREAFRKPWVVVTTYQSMALNIEALLQVQFQYVILDEGHKICNPNSAITIAAKTFATPHRLILTGSPIQNTLKELWCLFDFCRKGLLGTQSRFVEEFERPINYSRNPRATPLEQSIAIQCAMALREHIAPFLLRRLKKDVNARLPAKHERVIRCSLTDPQLDMYVNFLMTREVQGLLQSCADNRLNQTFKDGGAGFLADGTFVSTSGRRGGLIEKNYYRAYHILSQLRLLCSHADIFRLKLEDTAEGGSGKNISFRSNNPVDYSGSCKLDALRRLMVQWKANGHKVLIFSQWVMALDIIENCVEQEGYSYVRVDGKTPSDHRSVLLDKFNEDPSIFCALLTTRVGGLGLNLTGADRVVLFDPDWNPKVDEQARERAWRIGQKREVCVYRMITSGTIEEHILHRQLAKSYVTDKVLENPQLQQVFAVMSLVDGFYLSSHYSNRVASNVRPLVCSMQMDLLEDEDDVEVAREDARDNMNANAVKEELPTVKVEGSASAAPSRKTSSKVKLERGSSSAPATAAGSATDEPRHETAMLTDILEGAGTRVSRFNSTANGNAQQTERLAALATAGIMRRIQESGELEAQSGSLNQRTNTQNSQKW